MRLWQTIAGRFQKLIWAQLAKRTPSENAFLVLIPIVGATTGLAALGVAHLIAFLEKQFWGSGEQLLAATMAAPRYLRILVPALGGALLGLAARVLRLSLRGHGMADIIQALALKGGEVSLRKELPATGAGVLTVACGGSLGREGPMVDFGVAYSSWLGRRCKLSTQHLRVLVCSAAAAGLGAAYNAPIGGTIFAMEILIGNFALEIFGPVVIASVISTLIFRSALGNLPRFVIPRYELVSAWELIGYLALGILGGGFSVLMIKSLSWAEDAFAKLPVSKYVKPAIGFALVGVIGCWLPHVFGNGYSTVNLVLNERLPLFLLLALPLAKLAATALTRGSGGAGGLFTPSMMMGALVGGAFGYGLHAWFPAQTAEHGAYALVGMGAVIAGTTHAPITAIMMIFEQTNSYPIILPLMFACIISNFTARLLKPESLHLEALRRKGVVLPRGPEQAVMQNLRVAAVMHEDVEALPQTAPFAQVVEQFIQSRYNNLYVIDGQNRFLGAISLHELKGMLSEGESLGIIIARDLVNETFEFVTPEESLADIMELFWRQNSERLPVVDTRQNRRLIGWISKRDLLGIYDQEILKKRQLLSRFAYATEEGEREAFVELPPAYRVQTLPVPAGLVGQTLREIAPRARYGVYVLQVKHHGSAAGAAPLEMPGPETRLAAGDGLVVVGPIAGIARFQQAMADVEKGASQG